MQFYAFASSGFFLLFIPECLKWGEIAPQRLTEAKMTIYMRI